MANMNEYSGLNRAQLSYEYLHTNSTTHEFLFGALAELLDNARDANATKMEIYAVPDENLRGGYMLCFLDNGEGMDPAEANGIITFGRSNKRVMDSKMIGQYGNGLKSGAMRIANDFILFTKKSETMSCVFLSRTFHEEENLQEVIVPLPSFDVKTHKPHCCNTAAAKYRSASFNKQVFTAEMNLILKYSPFKTQETFMQQFDKITSDTGTLIIVYNMKLLDDGEPELISDPSKSDILLNSSEQERELMMPERWSFRAYASVLYAHPYMKIYIEGTKVRTKLFQHSLYKPRLYKYSSTRFKDRSKKEAQKAHHDSQVADMRAKEAESKARQLEKKVFTSSDKDSRLNLRKAQDLAEELREEANLRKKFSLKKQKDEKLPKILEFIFGINLERRTHDGLFIYNCSRLIKMYQKVGPQMEGGLNCSGVVGIVDVPYQVLEPTHNKQDFADAKEYRHLLKTLGEYMVQYWKDVEITKQGITQFWEFYGYLSNSWQHPPSNDSKILRRRAMQTDFYLQCDNCLKWRIIPFSSTNLNRSFPDEWTCSMNSDYSFNKCSAPEQKTNIAEGKLAKEIKSKELMEGTLEKKMDKIQNQLNKVKNEKNALSSNTSSRRGSSQSYVQNIVNNSRKVKMPSSPIKEYKPISPVTKKKPVKKIVKKEPPRKIIAVKSKKQECDTSVKEDDLDHKADTTVAPLSAISRVKTKRGLAGKLNKINYHDSDESSEETGQDADSSNNRGSRRTAVKRVKESFSNNVDSMQATSTSSPPVETFSSDEPSSKKSRISEKTDSTDEEESRLSQNSNLTNSEMNDDCDIGTRVQVMVKGKWYTGSITSFLPRKRVKVKFDKYADDKFDKIVLMNRSQLKIIKQISAHSTGNEASEVPSSSTSVSSPSSNVNSISTSTNDKSHLDQKKDVADDDTSENLLDDVSKSYRNCLRYFLPPHWIMKKEEITVLAPSELATFPLSDFVDHYESGIKKIMDNFQVEVDNQKKSTELQETKRASAELELENSKAKLSTLRKMIAKLLKSIHEEFDINPDDDTDRVDELVKACIEQLP